MMDSDAFDRVRAVGSLARQENVFLPLLHRRYA
jgi:hypothetical protein